MKEIHIKLELKNKFALAQTLHKLAQKINNGSNKGEFTDSENIVQYITSENVIPRIEEINGQICKIYKSKM